MTGDQNAGPGTADRDDSWFAAPRVRIPQQSSASGQDGPYGPRGDADDEPRGAADETRLIPEPRGYPEAETRLIPEAGAHSADETRVMPPAGGPATPGGGTRPRPGADAGHPLDSDTRALRIPEPVRAAWEQPDEPGHTHDPHEVTIQMDGVGRQLEDWLVQQAKGGAPVQEEAEGPVFVDESGRRRNRLRRLGILVGLACAAYAVVILATMMSGNSDAPWLPVPDPKDEQPASQVDTSPAPTDSVDRSASPSESAGSTAESGTTAPPGADGGAVSSQAADPGSSRDPEPSTSKKPAADPSRGGRPDPDPSTTRPNPPASSPVTDPEPDPSETADGGSGTDSAAGPAAQGEPAGTSSPENVI